MAKNIWRLRHNCPRLDPGFLRSMFPDRRRLPGCVSGCWWIWLNQLHYKYHRMAGNQEDNHRVEWTSYKIRKIAGCACAGNAGERFPRHRLQRKPLVSDPDMHHGTCARAVMHVGIANPRWRGKRSRHSWCMRNPKFYVSGKRPMDWKALACLGASCWLYRVNWAPAISCFPFGTILL